MAYHYSDVILGAMASQITSISIVFSTVYSGVDQRKHQSSASLAFVRGIHRWPVNSPTQMASNAENVSIWWRHHEMTRVFALMWRSRSVSSGWELDLCFRIASLYFWVLTLWRKGSILTSHHNGVTMDGTASQITDNWIVCSSVCRYGAMSCLFSITLTGPRPFSPLHYAHRTSSHLRQLGPCVSRYF